ncbi:hypothetical protein [Burkholderia multivorans]|uniref:hypothetical protein n=1 Tax=Burkholderia multivorans TaxID=87883 RepID=UPI001B91FEA6|nr:hypothetical protein [Burkholderia multivorans]MBR8142724.1 hypothetical protein [Burkholderia vietnamiensis]MBU9564995.1 hypothetical protein [Burkholderia multivorans]MCO8623727.1 hypothetical protein [Burkholderia multivorans]
MNQIFDLPTTGRSRVYADWIFCGHHGNGGTNENRAASRQRQHRAGSPTRNGNVGVRVTDEQASW